MAPSVSPWYDPRRASTSGGPFFGGSPARTSLQAAPNTDKRKGIVISPGVSSGCLYLLAVPNAKCHLERNLVGGRSVVAEKHALRPIGAKHCAAAIMFTKKNSWFRSCATH